MRLSQSINVDIKYESPIPHIQPSNVSIVIPVQNNPIGIKRFIDAILTELPEADARPLEIIIVDNNSKPHLAIARLDFHSPVDVRIFSCTRKGPAAARNMGISEARGDWILFCDSDCIPTSTLLTGYGWGRGPEIAFAGNVQAIPPSVLSAYYDSERTLVPYVKQNSSGSYIPAYLVTANAMVLKEALIRVGGFDERFQFAGGEDVNLSHRLWKLGPLGYAEKSIVLHDFSDGTLGLLKRFYRYGKGNRLVQRFSGIDMSPQMRKPRKWSVINLFLRVIQFTVMFVAYNWPRKG